MNGLLWGLQGLLALLYLSGGAYKTFKFDELAKQMVAPSRGGWRALGVLAENPLVWSAGMGSMRAPRWAPGAPGTWADGC